MATMHSEFHVSDTSRAKAFYSTVFGRKFQQMDGMDYHLVLHDDIGPDKAVSGALMMRNSPEHSANSSPRGAACVFDVTNIDTKYETALKNGGAEAAPPEDYDGVGRVCYCEDGEGNLFGLIQNFAEAK